MRANVIQTASVAHDRYGAGSVMVRGAITMTGKTNMCDKAGLQDCTYRDNVLSSYVIPFARRHAASSSFMMITLGLMGLGSSRSTFNGGIFAQCHAGDV